MKEWVIRFRYIASYDYYTPMMYLPIEGTRIKADTPEEAWEKFITEPGAGPCDNYKKEEIYEHF